MSKGRPPLQLLPAPEDREPAIVRSEPGEPGRVLAPGAPPSPGAVPFELATELRVGEAVIWWGRKDFVARRPIAWLLLAGLALLGFGTLLAPELWNVPWTELWKLLAPALAPAGLFYARELVSRRTVLVTESSVIVLDHQGRLDRLAFRNVRRVRRDLLTGGILLEGAAHKLRIPPELADDARVAIASQTRHHMTGGDGPDDPLRWLP